MIAPCGFVCFPPSLPLFDIPTSLKETIHFFTSHLSLLYKQPLYSLKQFFTSPLFFCCAFTLFFGYMNGVMITFAQEYQRQWHRQHPSIIQNEFTLDDVLFTIFSYKNLISFADTYLLLLVAFMVLKISFTPQRLMIFRRFAICLGLMFILRTIAVYVTLLSDPSQNKSTVVGNPLIEGVHVTTGYHVSTVDKMFSGHTCTLSLAGLFILHYWTSGPIIDLGLNKKYQHILSNVLKMVVVLYMFGGYCLFALVRIHYSTDIFIGCILSVLVFYWYHSYILLSSTRLNGFNKLICWIEQDATDLPKVVMFTPSDVIKKYKMNALRLQEEEKKKLE
ncbi:Sphingomyelin synthase-like domain-containing protein [Entamoeba marina]